jgi:hypothetical protein
MAFDDPLGTTLPNFRTRSNSTHTIHSNHEHAFNLFADGDEALFKQMQSLATITRQNQHDLQRILKILENKLYPTNYTMTGAEKDNTSIPDSTSSASLNIISEE